MYLEYKKAKKPTYKTPLLDGISPLPDMDKEEDRDVISERERVAANTSDAIIVRGMRKEYPDGKKQTKV